jgi:putative addiction module component (TIGR02574 family)
MEHLQDILQLSNADKLVMMEKIWESIDVDNIDVSDSQKQEIDRRLEKMKNGDMQFSNWEDARARIRAKLS